MQQKSEKMKNAAATILSDPKNRLLPHHAEWIKNRDEIESGVLLATEALRAVAGLVHSGDNAEGFHLKEVKSTDFVSLLSIITDRLEGIPLSQ